MPIEHPVRVPIKPTIADIIAIVSSPTKVMLMKNIIPAKTTAANKESKNLFTISQFPLAQSSDVINNRYILYIIALYMLNYKFCNIHCNLIL